MKFDFAAVDVECANADLASICQIGIATVQAGEIVETWSQYINPEDHFDPMNVRIHGIDESKVGSSLTFGEVFAEVDERLSGVVVSHSLLIVDQSHERPRNAGCASIRANGWTARASRAGPGPTSMRGVAMA